MEIQKSTNKKMEAASVVELQEILNDASDDTMVCVNLEVQEDE